MSQIHIPGYLLEEKINVNSQSGCQVWLGTQTSVDRNVVIKVYVDQDSFQKEKRMCLSLGDHPNTPSIIDTFQNDGIYALVLEQISGRSLDKVIKELSVKYRIKLSQQLVTTVLDVHRRTAETHNDISPFNCMVTDDDEPRLILIDFGAKPDECSVYSFDYHQSLGEARDSPGLARTLAEMLPEFSEHFNALSAQKDVDPIEIKKVLDQVSLSEGKKSKILRLFTVTSILFLVALVWTQSLQNVSTSVFDFEQPVAFSEPLDGIDFVDLKRQMISINGKTAFVGDRINLLGKTSSPIFGGIIIGLQYDTIYLKASKTKSYQVKLPLTCFSPKKNGLSSFDPSFTYAVHGDGHRFIRYFLNQHGHEAPDSLEGIFVNGVFGYSEQDLLRDFEYYLGISLEPSMSDRIVPEGYLFGYGGELEIPHTPLVEILAEMECVVGEISLNDEGKEPLFAVGHPPQLKDLLDLGVDLDIRRTK